MSEGDLRWMAAAIALSERGVGCTGPNPNVGCIITADGRVVGRGWTQPGGRPHAEAMALAAAGDAARGATVHVSLEPCAHVSARGPACADLLIAAGVARAVIGAGDPDPRTNGAGADRLQAAGIVVQHGVLAAEAEAAMAGFFMRQRHRRPHITLKLAVSLDGSVAMTSGVSRWITGARARAHAHLERARADLILVGRGTLIADDPRLDVRLPGLADRSPAMAVMSAADIDRTDMRRIANPAALAAVTDADRVLAEGGAGLATSLVAADLVDRLLLYRAPVLIGGRSMLGAIGLSDLGAAHGHWAPQPVVDLGPDRLETYLRVR